MRRIRRWLCDPRHGVWLAFAGILLPWLAVRVRRARGGHRATIRQRLAAPGVASGGARRLQVARYGTNGAGGRHGVQEWTVEG